jgi:hypothetical protein
MMTIFKLIGGSTILFLLQDMNRERSVLVDGLPLSSRSSLTLISLECGVSRCGSSLGLEAIRAQLLAGRKLYNDLSGR